MSEPLFPGPRVIRSPDGPSREISIETISNRNSSSGSGPKIKIMPTVTLSVNVPGEKALNLRVAQRLSSIAAVRTGKPESYVMTHVQSAQVMTFGGSEAPAGFVRFVSIGALNPETNASIAADVASLLNESYGVDASRTYIEFVDVKERFMFGWNGTTF